ncbi:hypothetical protein Syun_031085 [Stephania yunnanensis]|uniref:Uncharacterized protein n=1 Tax=Stephania yunnanensis TaxID=152371 RepID=A0AAP0E3R5_9MAGN
MRRNYSGQGGVTLIKLDGPMDCSRRRRKMDFNPRYRATHKFKAPIKGKHHGALRLESLIIVNMYEILEGFAMLLRIILYRESRASQYNDRLGTFMIFQQISIDFTIRFASHGSQGITDASQIVVTIHVWIFDRGRALEHLENRMIRERTHGIRDILSFGDHGQRKFSKPFRTSPNQDPIDSIKLMCLIQREICSTPDMAYERINTSLAFLLNTSYTHSSDSSKSRCPSFTPSSIFLFNGDALGVLRFLRLRSSSSMAIPLEHSVFNPRRSHFLFKFQLEAEMLEKRSASNTGTKANLRKHAETHMHSNNTVLQTCAWDVLALLGILGREMLPQISRTLSSNPNSMTVFNLSINNTNNIDTNNNPSTLTTTNPLSSSRLLLPRLSPS